MKPSRAIGLFTASMLLACSVMTSAQAALIHNLTTLFGSGQITFVDDVGSSGNSVSDVRYFTFDVDAGNFGGPQSYGFDDISSISWSITSDWSLTLNLVTNLVPFGSDQSGITLVNDDSFGPSACGTTSGINSSTCDTGIGATFGALTTEAVHPDYFLTTFFGLGQISFEDDVGSSGNSVSDVQDFSFNVDAGNFGGPQFYDFDDISSISWSIASDWSLTLNLVTNLVPFGSDQSGITLVNDDSFGPSACGTTSGINSSTCDTGIGASFGALTTEAANHAVPEPSTTLIFAVGLVCLIWLSRRRFSLCRRRFLGDFV